MCIELVNLSSWDVYIYKYTMIYIYMTYTYIHTYIYIYIDIADDLSQYIVPSTLMLIMLAKN